MIESITVSSPSVPDSRAPTRPLTVAEAYCRQRGLPPAAFERAVLQETLHPTARRLRFVLALIPRYFEPDMLFLTYVGRLRRLEDLRYEEIDFKQDRANRGFLRGQLRLRVSARRLRRVVQQTLGDTDESLNML